MTDTKAVAEVKPLNQRLNIIADWLDTQSNPVSLNREAAALCREAAREREALREQLEDAKKQIPAVTDDQWMRLAQANQLLVELAHKERDELRASIAAREKDVLALRDGLFHLTEEVLATSTCHTPESLAGQCKEATGLLATIQDAALAIEQRIRDSALEEAALVADAEWRSIPQQGNGIYISLVATVQRVGAAIRALKGTK